MALRSGPLSVRFSGRPARRGLPTAAFLLSLAVGMGGAAAGLGAQTPEELIEGARAARNAGDFAGAAALVERYLAARPEDAGSLWMLAQLRYWTGDLRAAERAYERALPLASAAATQDAALRADYASMLLGIGRLAEARRVILPLLSGEVASRSEAERILADIRALTPPWLVARASWARDDQPRAALEVQAEGGVYLTPAWTLAARLAPRRFDVGANGGAATRLDARGSTTLSSFDGRWAASATGGAALAEGHGELVYSGRLSLRAAPRLSLWAQLERGAYEWTRASLDSLLMASALEVALDAEAAPRWAGAARWRRDRFEDENSVSTAFAWLLAPVAPGVRIGYALAWQDAEASRWERDPEGSPVSSRPAGRGDTIPGRYAPYYTPDDVVAHTLLVEGTTRVGPASLRAQAGYAFHASEQAPVLVGGGGSTVLPFTYERRLSPWYAVLSLTRPLGPDADLEVTGEYRESSYYRLGRASLGVLRRWR